VKSMALTVPMAIATWWAIPVGSAVAANDGAVTGMVRIAAAPTPVTTELLPPRSEWNTNTNTNINTNTDTNTAIVTDSTVQPGESAAPPQTTEAERNDQAERGREVAAEVRAEAERERADKRARTSAERAAEHAEHERQRVAAERERAADREADEQHAKVEARLREAQARLQQAAQEVARLSAEVSRSVMQRFNGNWWQRAVIGVVISHDNDPAGAHVAEVSPGGAAADAGLRAGDVIVSINDTGMGGPHAAQKVVDAVQGAGPNGKLTMHIRRDNKDQKIEVVARTPAGWGGAAPFVFAAPPAPAAPAAPAAPPAPPAPGAPNVQHIETYGGPFSFSLAYGYQGLGSMELATLTPQLGHYFGTDKGVLVVRAPKDSSFKLQDGDVILSIDGREAISGTHATRILASYQPGEKVVLHIMRERKAMNLETTLPESAQGRHRPARSARQPEANS